MRRGGPEAAEKELDRQLETSFVNIDLHGAAMAIYDKLGDKEKFALHEKIARGLVEAIMKAGDGKTAETAFPVIEVREEYTILGALGLEHSDQKLQSVGGHKYDVMTVEKDGKPVDVYFNIDAPMKWLENSLGGAAKGEGDGKK